MPKIEAVSEAQKPQEFVKATLAGERGKTTQDKVHQMFTFFNNVVGGNGKKAILMRTPYEVSQPKGTWFEEVGTSVSCILIESTPGKYEWLAESDARELAGLETLHPTPPTDSVYFETGKVTEKGVSYSVGVVYYRNNTTHDATGYCTTHVARIKKNTDDLMDFKIDTPHPIRKQDIDAVIPLQELIYII